VKFEKDERPEEWRPVVGYEGLYEVSNRGRVRSLLRKTRIKDKSNYVMAQKMDRRGYRRVNLHKNKKCKACLVSRLVAMAFVPNPNNYYQVGHNDDNKLNNNAENLYWTYHQENLTHNGLHLKTRDKRQKKIKQIAAALSVPVIGTNRETGEEVYFPSMQATKAMGFRPNKVSRCCAGICETHFNYLWRKA